MKTVVTAEQMAAADAFTIETLGISGVSLMEKAAQSCFEVLHQECQGPCNIAIIAGAGNNGGDGLALARMLFQAGYSVEVFTLKDASHFRGDAAANYQWLLEIGLLPKWIQHLDELVISENTRWIVDAILGTGLRGPVRGLAGAVIDFLNAQAVPILAVDLPSGLCGNDGRALEPHVRAQRTVTFQNYKMAHVIAPACLSCGKVEVADIGVKYADVDGLTTYFCEAEDFAMPPRPLNSHKGRFGSLGIIGGFEGMTGAVNLAGMAAMRFGAGKVRLLNDDPTLVIRHDSLMSGHWQKIESKMFDALVIGPGLSREAWVWKHLEKIPLGEQPIVWDADGLYYLKTQVKIPGKPWVMTPHPGEAAHLLGISVASVQADRLAALKRLGERFPGGWCVLKGFRTMVLSPEGEVFVIGTGNPALATAGSGDVLAGMMGALFAQGFCPDEAVLLACLRHGIAADRWVRYHPDYSMIAEDIISDLTNPGRP